MLQVSRSTVEILHNKCQQDMASSQSQPAVDPRAEQPRGNLKVSRSLSPAWNFRSLLPLSADARLRVQSFSLHIGAELKVPTTDRRRTHVAESVPQLSASQRAAASDPFAGLPLRAWADRVGERVAPAFKAVQEEQRRSNLAAAKTGRNDQPLAVPDVPAYFFITRWCVCVLTLVVMTL